jgi:transcriptional regulator with XRE-family HTH domain
MNAKELLEAREASASGRALRLRKAAGLSQIEVAAMAGISQSAVHRWELGLRRPHGEAAERWACALRELAALVAGGGLP